MGFLHHLLWHHGRRRPQSYRQYAKARQRRERFRDRYEAEHPSQRQQQAETFQGAIRLADGTELGCEHEHRTKSAAQDCARRLASAYRAEHGGAA